MFKKVFLSICILFTLIIAASAQESNFDLAYEAYSEGDYNKSIDLYSLYLDEYESINAHFNRGLAYYKLGDYENAIFDYTYVIKEDPEDYEAWYNRGLAYYDAEEYDLSIQDNEMAISLMPTYDKAYNGLGLCYAAKGKHEDAIDMYSQAISLKSSSSLSYYNRALSYQDLYMYDEAEEDYNKAIKINDEDPDYYWGRGDLYYDMYYYEESIDDYTKAIALDDQNENLFYNRGISYYDNEDYEAAEKDFEAVLNLVPNDIDAKWYVALCANEIGKEEKALAFYNEVEEEDPDYEYLWAIDKRQLELKIFLKKNWLYGLGIIAFIIAAIVFMTKMKRNDEQVVRRFD
ncbi:MAG: tetratricopeptide repeat protein [Chitinophagales bacterium]|nr:tetratricopeptide repeat protein [Chitinophagales bacterium]